MKGIRRLVSFLKGWGGWDLGCFCLLSVFYVWVVLGGCLFFISFSVGLREFSRFGGLRFEKELI